MKAIEPAFDEEGEAFLADAGGGVIRDVARSFSGEIEEVLEEGSAVALEFIEKLHEDFVGAEEVLVISDQQVVFEVIEGADGGESRGFGAVAKVVLYSSGAALGDVFAIMGPDGG